MRLFRVDDEFLARGVVSSAGGRQADTVSCVDSRPGLVSVCVCVIRARWCLVRITNLDRCRITAAVTNIHLPRQLSVAYLQQMLPPLHLIMRSIPSNSRVSGLKVCEHNSRRERERDLFIIADVSELECLWECGTARVVWYGCTFDSEICARRSCVLTEAAHNSQR